MSESILNHLRPVLASLAHRDRQSLQGFGVQSACPALAHAQSLCCLLQGFSLEIDRTNQFARLRRQSLDHLVHQLPGLSSNRVILGRSTGGVLNRQQLRRA